MSDAMVKNAADPKQVKKAERLEREAVKKKREDLRVVLEMPEGRRVIARWLADFKIGQLRWKPGAEINREVARYECANHILSAVVSVDPAIGAKDNRPYRKSLIYFI